MTSLRLLGAHGAGLERDQPDRVPHRCPRLGAAATVPSTFAMLFRSFPAARRVRASALASGTPRRGRGHRRGHRRPADRPVRLAADLRRSRPSLALAALLPALVVLKQGRAGRGVSSRSTTPARRRWRRRLLRSCFGINRIGAWGAEPDRDRPAGLRAGFGIWLLVLVERRAAAPLLPLRLMSARNTWVVMSATFILNIGWMGTFILTPLLLQSVMGLSAGLTSLIVVPRADVGHADLAAGRPARSALRRRRRVVGAASCLSPCGSCLVAFAASITSVALIAVCMVLGGLLFGIPATGAGRGHRARGQRRRLRAGRVVAADRQSDRRRDRDRAVRLYRGRLGHPRPVRGGLPGQRRAHPARRPDRDPAARGARGARRRRPVGVLDPVAEV